MRQHPLSPAVVLVALIGVMVASYTIGRKSAPEKIKQVSVAVFRGWETKDFEQAMEEPLAFIHDERATAMMYGYSCAKVGMTKAEFTEKMTNICKHATIWTNLTQKTFIEYTDKDAAK